MWSPPRRCHLVQRLSEVMRPETLEGAIPSLATYGPTVVRQVAKGIFHTLLGGYSVAITLLNLTASFFVFPISRLTFLPSMADSSFGADGVSWTSETHCT